MIKKTLLLTVTLAIAIAAPAFSEGVNKMTSQPLSEKEICIVDIGAALARGDQTALAGAFNRGFDAQLTLAEAKEYVGHFTRIAVSRARSMRRQRFKTSSRNDSRQASRFWKASPRPPLLKGLP